ncbi:RNA polymerase-binding protein RbpA, partial [Cellulosimicrobium funkei]
MPLVDRAAARTHWAMLLARRTISELQELLDDRHSLQR